MKFGSLFLAAAIMWVPAAAHSAVVQYVAPAGNLPAGHLRNAMYDAVLPSGRIVTPFGQSTVTGIHALGFTLTPDGRFAIVSNDDERFAIGAANENERFALGAVGDNERQAPVRSAIDPRITGGPSLAVVDVATMHVIDRFALPGETYFAGIAAVRDPRASQRSLIFAAGGPSNAVYVLDLDANGHITPNVQHVISIAGPADPAFADFGQSFPSTLIAARDGRFVYAIGERGSSVTAIDTAARAVSGTSRGVGFFPFGAALARDRILVANEGLMRYASVAEPPLVPAFANPPADEQRASSLSFVDLTPDGGLAPSDPLAPAALAMDAPPDGVRIVGGAHPAAIAVTPDGGYAFVAMTNVDRIATVALGGTPRVVGGTEMRLFDRGPYGTQPAALALSADGTRLYVALAGLDAIAVLDARDPAHLHRLGLIPAGWFPSALALSADDRMLYVLNTKGFGHDIASSGEAANATGTSDPGAGGRGASGPGANGAGASSLSASAVWSTLQKIDLSTVTLSDTTFTALKNTREIRTAPPTYPHALRNVVVIVEENKTFDAMLGDLGYGPADPASVSFGAAVTPNLHALARRYALAANFYADAEESDTGHQFLTCGTASVYSQRTQFITGSLGFRTNGNQNPEDAPRAGSIFNNLERHHISFRDYGDLVRLAGYDEGQAPDPTVDDPAFAGIDDRTARTSGLGGRYAAAVPAPAVLAGHIDPDYPGWNVRIRNERRAREFMRDYTLLVRAHRQPRFTQIWLPADHTGVGPDVPPISEEVADGDRALGTIVQYLSRLSSWKHTAIFVLPDDARNSRDHLDAHRAYAIVVSPFAKPHYVGMRHLSTVSVLKTTEQIFGLPPLALGDLLATDMSDFFGESADVRPFEAIAVPVQAAARAIRAAFGFGPHDVVASRSSGGPNRRL